jgi:hypothetical protein
MKKRVFVAIFCLLAALCFSEDALVQAPGSLLITNTYSVGWIPGAYNINSDYNGYGSGGGNWTYFNIGLALELGLNDWITAGVQWAPGMNVWSQTDLKMSLPIPPFTLDFTKGNISLPFDPLIGVKFQLVGPKAPFVSREARFVFAPGIKIPLPAADMYQESKKFIENKSFVIGDPDLRAFGYGAAMYADVILHELAFLNLYFQVLQFLPVKKNSFNPITPVDVKSEYDYLYLYTIELEPHFRMPLGSAMKIGASLPARALIKADNSMDGAIQANTGYFLMSLGPKLLLLLTDTPVPLEFKLGFDFPVMGMNLASQRMLTLQVRPLLKVF